MTLTIRAVRAGGKARMPSESLVERGEDRCYSPTVASQVPGDFSLSVMPSPDAIEQEVRQFLRDNFPLSADGVALDSEDSLIEVGVIDSTGVLELIGFIEERYELTIADEEVLPENLDSIANITRFVGEKTASANGAG
jgi:acyl carrier protein